MILDKIEAIIYINLANAVKRRKRIHKFARTYFPGVKIYRFNAVDRKTIYDENNYKVWDNNLEEYLTYPGGAFNKKHSGTIGCYMSHYNVIKYIMEQYGKTDKVVLVLE